MELLDFTKMCMPDPTRRACARCGEAGVIPVVVARSSDSHPITIGTANRAAVEEMLTSGVVTLWSCETKKAFSLTAFGSGTMRIRGMLTDAREGGRSLLVVVDVSGSGHKTIEEFVKDGDGAFIWRIVGRTLSQAHAVRLTEVVARQARAYRRER